MKNFILFWAGTNIDGWEDWILKNKIYQEDIDTNDKHWIYWTPSSANSKNDNNIDRHLLVTIWTNYIWNIDQTNEIVESSKFPVWFHNKIWELYTCWHQQYIMYNYDYAWAVRRGCSF